MAETEKMGTRAYWRSKFLELKDRINILVSVSEELEQKILRQMEEFYRMDDPIEREQMIRPQLQNSMRRRDELAEELAEAQTKLTEFLENAGQEGALPEWFQP
ncbi:MAG: hypothetical protein K8R59_14915 [Thermoanaerobaculales bacterium]|nr:hypothetical protein [Thermoanaerobaculales bacterium]